VSQHGAGQGLRALSIRFNGSAVAQLGRALIAVNGKINQNADGSIYRARRLASALYGGITKNKKAAYRRQLISGVLGNARILITNDDGIPMPRTLEV